MTVFISSAEYVTQLQEERDRVVVERNYANTLKDAAVEQLAISRANAAELRKEVERLMDELANARYELGRD